MHGNNGTPTGSVYMIPGFRNVFLRLGFWVLQQAVMFNLALLQFLRDENEGGGM
jgi:hypothetical protein